MSEVAAIFLVSFVAAVFYGVGRLHGWEKWATHAPLPLKVTDEMVRAAAMELTDGQLEDGYSLIGKRQTPGAWRDDAKNALTVAMRVAMKAADEAAK